LGLFDDPVSTLMASFFYIGSKISFNGIRGEVLAITETYRKNVLVVKVSDAPKYLGCCATVGLFEYPDGTLEFMTVID
jgi:hypothetical protein